MTKLPLSQLDFFLLFFNFLFLLEYNWLMGLSGKESTCQCRRHVFYPWVGKISWRRKWQPNVVFLPGKPHGQRNLAGYSPWGRKESGTTQWLNSNSTWLMLWYFQVDIEGSQAYIYTYPFSSKLPSHPGWHITLSKVPCAIQ